MATHGRFWVDVPVDAFACECGHLSNELMAMRETDSRCLVFCYCLRCAERIIREEHAAKVASENDP